MGRLNYTNRKIAGEKLGCVCARDLTKRIPPAVGSKAALRDPVLELDVSHKSLTDDGLAILLNALIETLHANATQDVCLLEELNLAGNDLTVKSLVPLADVIRLTAHDLRDIDLSDNQLTVRTREDALAWETFLGSFAQCCMLRRLNLSRNPLSHKAFEIMARVYGREAPVDLVIPESVTSAIDIKDGTNGTHHNRRHERYHSPRCKDDSIWTLTRGLRSIPYIVLREVNLDNTSALHLSYILVLHHTPERLLPHVPPAKPGAPTQQLLAYNESDCDGIIYMPNEMLSTAGAKALRLAEDARDSLQAVPASTSPITGTDDGAVSVECMNNLDRARSRLQGQCLEEYGHAHHDLWRCALQMLSLGRLIQPTPVKPQFSMPIPPIPRAVTPPPRKLVIRAIDLSAFPPLRPTTPAPRAWPLAPKSTNSIVLRQDTRPPQEDKDEGKQVKTPQEVSPTPSICTGQTYRSNLPGRLPKDIWTLILAYATDSDRYLSHAQQTSVLNYAMDRQTLKTEREMLGLKEGVRKWHVLEAMDCLGYEMQ